MKDWAYYFGDRISFDVTYKVVKNEKKNYGLGVFVGADTNLRITPIGLAVIGAETTENFMKLF